MFTEQEIEEIVSTCINGDEDLGHQSGAGDHIGHISYVIEKIDTEKEGEYVVIVYQYTIIVETEFTIYPDNPPYEYLYEKTIKVDKDKNVIEASEKKGLKGPELDWEIPEDFDDE